MKIAKKLILAFTGITLLIGAVASFLLFIQLDKVSEPLRSSLPKAIEEVVIHSRLDHLAQFIRYYDEVLTQSARNYAFTKSKKWEKRYREAEPKLDEAIKEAIELDDKVIKLGNEGHIYSFSEVDQANLALIKMAHESIELVNEGKSNEAIRVLESDEYWNQKAIYENSLKEYAVIRDREYDEAIVASTSTLETAVAIANDLVISSEQLIILSIGIVLVLAVGSGYLFSRSISRSLVKLSDAAGQLGKGNLDYRVDIKTGDEIERVADSFNKMTHDLGESTTSIERLNKEVSERKEAEQLLEKQKELLGSIVSHVPHFIFWKDINSVYLGCNDNFARSANLEKVEDIVGKTDHDLPWAETNADLYRKDDKEVIESGKAKLNYEESQTGEGGNKTELLTSKVPLRDSKGEIIGVLGIYLDITERKRQEQRLKESQLRYKTIFDASKDSVMTLAPGGKFISGNQATVEMFRCQDEEEFTAKTPAELSPEYQPDGQLSEISSKHMMDICMREGSHFFEWEHRRLNGELFPTTVLLTKMYIKGEYILQATVRDITERKEIEDELRKLSQAVRQSPSVVAITDLEGKIEYVNPKFCEVTGYSFEEVKGKNPRVLKSGDMPDDVYKKMWDMIVRGLSWHGEFHNKDRKGKLYWEAASISGITDANGKITHYIKVAEDVTMRKIVEGKAEEAIKVKSEFVSMVSHELRTPLAVIKEGVAIVSDGVAGELNVKQKEFLSVARKNVDRLARLINNVLDFQKLEAGMMNYSIRLNDIGRVIEEVQESMNSVANNKNLKLKVELDEKLPKTKFDRDKIIQVLTNIISNSLKFTERGSVSVKVAQDKKAKSICFSITDTGPGIKKKDLPRLFIKFEQLGESKDRKAGGTGLGLAISKEIIEHHGGEIWAESEFGKGTTFKFTLPV